MVGVENKTYYELLGVGKAATKEQIRDAYKELARIYHPDSHFYDEVLEGTGLLSVGETDTFKIITLAYNTLSNEKTRKEYDESMPADLPSWEENHADSWHVDHRVATSPANHTANRTTTNAYGNFGVEEERRQQPNRQQPQQRPQPKKKSAFDEEHLRNLRPVSEMIKARRGFWYKIRWLMFLEK